MVETTVYAKSINRTQFYFECPFCWTKYKKNGEPSKNAKKVIHCHGSNNELHNRKEHRSSHCPTRYRGSFNIIIDDNTFKNYH